MDDRNFFWNHFNPLSIKYMLLFLYVAFAFSKVKTWKPHLDMHSNFYFILNSSFEISVSLMSVTRMLLLLVQQQVIASVTRRMTRREKERSPAESRTATERDAKARQRLQDRRPTIATSALLRFSCPLLSVLDVVSSRCLIRLAYGQFVLPSLRLPS